jgi:2-polyprenyl-3-methyl-5-hydroxy-6-metoxy-1,4-benzoquinol methylase
MDQKSLYDLQVVNKKAKEFSSLTVNGRDKYVINHIMGSFNMSGANLTMAELSIGVGSFSQALISSFRNVKLTCADISPTRIAQTRKAIDQLPDSSTSDVEYLECNFDTQFDLLHTSKNDVVIALDIMEHVVDVFNFIQNCSRILKQNGVLYLRVPNIAYVRHRVRLLFGELPITASWFKTKGEITAWRDHHHGWDGGHLHLFTIPTLNQLLNTSGFEVVECRDPGCSFSTLRNFLPKLLYGNPLITAKKV